MEQKQQLLLQQQMLVDAVKLSPNFFLHVPMGLTGNSLLPISIYCPFLCAYFGDSNKGVLAIREANSIQKLKCYGEKNKTKLDLPAAGQLKRRAPHLTSPAQPRNVKNYHRGYLNQAKGIILVLLP